MKKKLEVYLRHMGSQPWLIDVDWGFGELNNILLNQEIGFEAPKVNVQYYDDVFNYIGDVQKANGKNIAVIAINGVMTENDGWCNYGMNTIDGVLRNLYADSKVDAVMIKMSTGGGSVIAADIFQNSIADRNKPVVVYTTHMASGGIKGTLHADEIIGASDNTIVGSIGVMISLPKWIVESEDIIDVYSKKSENKNKEFRMLKNGDESGYVEFLTQIDNHFMSQVSKYRPLKGSDEYKKETLSGAIFMGSDAKKRGLIDGVGTMNYALKRIYSHIRN